MEQAQDFRIDRLGECTFTTPMRGTGFMDDRSHILLHSDLDTIRTYLDAGEEPPRFEAAGPRQQLYFDPARVASLRRLLVSMRETRPMAVPAAVARAFSLVLSNQFSRATSLLSKAVIPTP